MKGTRFVWPRHEHCLLLIGYDRDSYYVRDPYQRNSSLLEGAYPRDLLHSRYQQLFQQAVVIHRLPAQHLPSSAPPIAFPSLSDLKIFGISDSFSVNLFELSLKPLPGFSVSVSIDAASNQKISGAVMLKLQQAVKPMTSGNATFTSSLSLASKLKSMTVTLLDINNPMKGVSISNSVSFGNTTISISGTITPTSAKISFTTSVKYPCPSLVVEQDVTITNKVTLEGNPFLACVEMLLYKMILTDPLVLIHRDPFFPPHLTPPPDRFPHCFPQPLLYPSMEFFTSSFHQLGNVLVSILQNTAQTIGEIGPYLAVGALIAIVLGTLAAATSHGSRCRSYRPPSIYSAGPWRSSVVFYIICYIVCILIIS